MHLYLTQEGLESIAADYRRQASECEHINGVRRAEGAAAAIEHLIKECYLAPQEPSVEVPVETPSETASE